MSILGKSLIWVRHLKIHSCPQVIYVVNLKDDSPCLYYIYLIYFLWKIFGKIILCTLYKVLKRKYHLCVRFLLTNFTRVFLLHPFLILRTNLTFTLLIKNLLVINYYKSEISLYKGYNIESYKYYLHDSYSKNRLNTPRRKYLNLNFLKSNYICIT